MPLSLKQTTSLLFYLLILVALTIISWRALAFWQQYNNLHKSLTVDSAEPSAIKTSKTPDIAQWNLFGQPNKTQIPVKKVIEDLPETRLQLRLLGVSSTATDGNDWAGTHVGVNTGANDITTQQQTNWALVEDQSKKADFFYIGDKLPGNARLHSVFANRIVIDRNGKLEELFFPDDWDKRPINQPGGTNRRTASDQVVPNNPFEQAVRRNNNFERALRQSQGLPEDESETDNGYLGEASSTIDEADSEAISEAKQEQIRNRLEQLRERFRQQAIQ